MESHNRTHSAFADPVAQVELATHASRNDSRIFWFVRLDSNPEHWFSFFRRILGGAGLTTAVSDKVAENMRSAHSLPISSALLLSLFLLTGCGGTSGSGGLGRPPTLFLNTVVSGLSSPVDLQFPNDNTGRFFVVEQPGTIRIIKNGTPLPVSFLDIRSKVDFGGEKGLLGLAFHPSYGQNRRFSLNYDRISAGQMQTVIAQYQASASDPDQADPNSERIVLTVNHPFSNHKGGQLAFGPDGFLYIGLGDGGSEGDPLGNGQSLQTLLGKMLRIDVDHMDSGLQYAIPGDNPFVSGGDLPEIWAYACAIPGVFLRARQ
jgi:Glucose / Sorbosone dehydrogenase